MGVYQVASNDNSKNRNETQNKNCTRIAGCFEDPLLMHSARLGENEKDWGKDPKKETENARLGVDV